MPAWYYVEFELTLLGGLPAGPHSIQFVADYYNAVTELSEANNSMTKSWTWTGALPPSGVTAVPGPNSEQVTVGWAYNDNQWISHYKIYYGTSSGNYSWMQDNVPRDWTTFPISNLTNGVPYYVAVTSVSYYGVESGFSNEVSAVPAQVGDSTPPSAPSSLTVINPGNGSQLILNWSPSTDDTGVDYYLVYRLTNNPTVSGYNYDSGYPRFISSTACTDSGLSDTNTYYYKVQAVDLSGNGSELSNLAYATPSDQVAPSAPPQVGISAENAAVFLWWSVPTTNTDGSLLTDLAGFNIYRGTSSGSYGAAPINGSIPVTTTWLIDQGVTNGQTYYYVVKAVDDQGNEGPASSEVSGTPQTDLAPSPPATLSITEKETSLALAWNRNYENDVAGYNVYRKTTGGNYSRLNGLLLTTEWFEDNTAGSGQTYYYVVTAVDAAGNESGPSNEVSGVIGQGTIVIIAPTSSNPYTIDFSFVGMAVSSAFTTHQVADRIIRYRYTVEERLVANVHLEIKDSETGEVVYTAWEWNPSANDPYFTWNGKYSSIDSCVPDGFYDTKLYLSVSALADPYAETVEPRSILITGCDRVVVSPPHNPDPDNNPGIAYYSFLSNSIIEARAAISPRGNASEITWTVTPTIGGISNENPANRIGPSFSFRPAPPAHPAYLAGTSCANPGNGSCNRSQPLTYRIKAEYNNGLQVLATENTIPQDQRDIIRQEYLNHGLNVPARAAFNIPMPTANFSVADIVGANSYSVVLGTPGNLAEAVRNQFNRLIYDDVQVRPVGTAGLNEFDVVVGPGANIDMVGPLLNTPPCNGAPNPATCDDRIFNNNIIAGVNGIAETVAVNQVANFGLRITSGWRNPERNEAVGGVPNSRHQLGNAVDIDHLNNVPNRTWNELNCILETAADRVPGADGFTEHNGSVRLDCRAADVTHVHVQQ